MKHVLIVGVACAGLGFAAGALKWRGSAERFHQQARLAAILSQAKQIPAGGVLVIGDSIAERVRMPFLCGRPALNAGIGWATSKDLLGVAPEIIAAARPSVVIVESGANDHGRFSRERARLDRLATFTIPNPTSTVDGVHPDLKGDRQVIGEIEAGCRQATVTPRVDK